MLVAALIASQFLLPLYAENRVDGRLERDGGRADVSISAFPALRLLAKHGDELKIDAEDVRIDPDAGQSRVLEDLDRFKEVRITLTDSRAGPIEVSDGSLDRDEGDATYRFVLDGNASGASLADYLQGGSSGPLTEIEGLARSITGVSAEVPIALDLSIESNDGRPVVVAGGGSVGGFPASLFVQMISSALSGRL